MNLFTKIIGHSKPIANLQQILKSARRPHALLFSGPQGVGKKQVALAWAQGLLCSDSTAKPCGRCPSCTHVVVGTHADLSVLSAQGATFKIDQVREVQSYLSLRSMGGRGRVVIFNDAHLLTTQAANALLKTLEEPADLTYFVLVTHQRGALPITILSRCQSVLFGHHSPAEMASILKTKPELAQFSFGSLDMAQKLDTPDFSELKTKAGAFLSQIPKHSIAEAFKLAADIMGDREEALFALSCWARWTRWASGTSLAPAQQTQPLGREDRDVVNSLVKSFNAINLLELSQRLLRLEQDINANVSRVLATEKFWLDSKQLVGQ